MTAPAHQGISIAVGQGLDSVCHSQEVQQTVREGEKTWRAPTWRHLPRVGWTSRRRITSLNTTWPLISAMRRRHKSLQADFQNMQDSAAPAKLLIIGAAGRLGFPEQWPGRLAVPFFLRGYPGGESLRAPGQLQASGARLHSSSGLVRNYPNASEANPGRP